MRALSIFILQGLCLSLLPAMAMAEEDPRDAFILSASTTLSADVAAQESAVWRVMNGFGHVNLSGNGLFLASRSRESMARGWVAFQIREYRGGTRGVSAQLMSGYDVPVMRQSRAGLALTLARADLDTGEEVRSRTLSFGPYIRTQVGEHMKLKTWMSLARPVYRLAGGGKTRATRLAAGARAYFDRRLGALKLSGSASLALSRQVVPELGDLSGFEISKRNASLSARATFRPDRDLRPFVGFGLSDGRWRKPSGSGAYTTPRLSTGISWSHKRRSLSLSVDSSRVFDPDRPLTLNTTYRTRF
ncbi:MAG: autotransporter domain-containing protein [Paracoccaceae bacterium]|jgi:hypothetical protein|uniref:autotransporter domain-containing protein n=1 Tax=Salipiger profundus TaxID=1229727 RepID=UPI0008EEB734|nr:autotransporter domain-containing protein [Salipiger profundus]SFD45683.1 hypothetical protein SAMN05444415_11138 [Salipiger profundus]